MFIFKIFMTIILLGSTLLADKEFHKSIKTREQWVKSLDNIEDNETKQTISDHILSNFGLKAYQDNFLIVGYRKGEYENYTVSDEYTNHEAEMQISLSYDVTSNLFGLDEVYSVALTYHAFWQIFTKSAPFRETNYNPEAFVTFPVYTESWLGLKAFKIAPFAHMSNGQGNIQTVLDENNITTPSDNTFFQNRSRSWNYAYASLYFQHRTLFTELTAWYRYPDEGGDDNPDLIDYLGYGSLTFYFPYKRHLFKTMARYNFEKGNGAVEGTWSYPLSNSQSTYLYFKAFSGYGESLIDYNNYITKFSLGLSFSR